MLKLGLVGASIHQAPLELLSALTIPRENREETLQELAEACGFDELVYVSTCNRVEFVFKTDAARPLHQSRNLILDYFFKGKSGLAIQPENFYVKGGIEAARHLFSVASALDSLVIGEAQILGQLKDAFCESQAAGLAREELSRVFQAAFRCAKKVRRQTAIGTKRVSIINLAAAFLQEFVDERPRCRVALIGVGPMTAKLAQAFRSFGVEDLYFVNRTVEKAEELARQWRGTAMSLDEFMSAPPCVDAVCTATASAEAIFGREETERLLAAGDVNRPFLFVDLAIPRDVADDVTGIRGVRVCHLGTLRDLSQKNRRERFRAADLARELVDDAVGRYHKDVVETTLSPLFCDTQKQAQAFAQSGLETLFGGKLEELDPAQRDALRYWVMNKLVPSVLHMPMKAIADSAGPEQWCCPEEKHCRGGLRVHGLRLSPPKC